jgi:hypothetical protein
VDKAYGFSSTSKKIVFIDMAAGSSLYCDVAQVPLATCAKQDQLALFVLYKNTGIAEYSLPDFKLIRTIPWSVPSYFGASVHYHMYCGTDRLYVVDANWAPGLWTVDDLSAIPIVVDHTAKVSSIGDMVLSPDESEILVWEQYGWSAGSSATSVSRIKTSDWTVTAKTTLPYTAGFNRDPLDVPVLWDRTRDLVLNKNQIFLASDLSKVMFSFPGNSPLAAPENIYAFDEVRGRFATRKNLYSLNDFHLIAPTTTPQATQYFFDRYGRLRMLTDGDVRITCQVIAP